MHEGFEFGWEPLEVKGYAGAETDGVMAGANVWPKEPEGFREVVLKY